MAPESVILIVPVPLLKVRLLVVAVFQTVPVPVSSRDVAPNVTVLVSDPDAVKVVHVTFFPFRSNPPITAVIVLVHVKLSVKVYEPPLELTYSGNAIDTLFVVMLYADLPASVSENVLVVKHEEDNLKSPRQSIPILAAPRVTASSTPERSRDGTTPTLTEIVPLVENDAESNITVSCGSGMLAPPAPPLDVDHLAVLSQLPPPPTQYLVTGESAVILVLFPILPILVPVNGAAAPAATQSQKLTFERDTAAAFNVKVLPNVCDTKEILRAADAPLAVNVPVTI